MIGRTKFIIFALAAFVAGAAVTAALTTTAPVAPGDRAAIEKIIREYVVSNPEIVTDALQELQNRAVAKAVADNRSRIETPFAGAWEGAANPQVTVVQFFDYNCGYCRAALPNIERLLKDEKGLRIVYREFPVLGPDSENAARVALAAAKAGKYPAFHRALYAGGAPEPRKVEQIARSMGIDLAFASDPAAQAEIDGNLNLARPLNLSGTPSWVIGNRVLYGNVSIEQLREAVAAARTR